MYCIDTNIIIEYTRGNKEIKDKLDRIFKLDLDINITVITLCELYRGIFLQNDYEKAFSILNELIDNFIVLNMTKETSINYGKLYSKLKEKGKLTQDIDLMIGSIVITNNQILITRNKKHFENIPSLKLEVW